MINSIYGQVNQFKFYRFASVRSEKFSVMIFHLNQKDNTVGKLLKFA